MATATPSDPLIPLRNGPVVPLSVVVWLVDAEFRGLRFSLAPDGRVHIGPKASVTPGDLAFARANRDALRACISYIEVVA